MLEKVKELPNLVLSPCLAFRRKGTQDGERLVFVIDLDRGLSVFIRASDRR
jgi:hypothetical protein